MRQPIVARSHRRTRQQRLTRTLVVFVVLIVLVVLVGKCAGGKKAPQATPKLAFAASTSAESNGATPDPGAAKTESARIVAMLDDWYQTAFVDPKLYGDGTFRSVRAHFTGGAATQFGKDIDSLTIGEARTEVSRVVPGPSRVDVTVFFQDGRTPKFAVAAVTFVATATLKAKDSLPLRISQKATYHLDRRPNGDWIVSYYTVHESQDSVQPSPSGSPS